MAMSHDSRESEDDFGDNPIKRITIHWFPGNGMACEIARRPGARALCGAGFVKDIEESADHTYQITCPKCLEHFAGASRRVK